MRPKSKATVVVDLPRTSLRSSTAAPACVIVSSVLSGRISLTERTMVVLPTPKPPTTTIFRPLSAVLPTGARRRRSEVTESNEHLLQDVGIGKPDRDGGVRDGGR